MTAVLDLGEWEITVPGVYPGIPEAVYHADPVPWGSLSSSGARRLLDCPARFRYGEDKATRRMEFGTAAHAQLLGVGAEIVEVAGASNGAWSTKEAKAALAAARDAGQVPVKPEQARVIKAMTARLAEHQTASRLFTPGAGMAEVTVIWADEQTGVWRRARIDWLPHDIPGRPLLVTDYKTAESAAPGAVSQAIGRYGYALQGAWYRDAARWARPGADVRFVLVVQETSPPYLVEVYEIDPRDLDDGAWQNRQAMERFRDCCAVGRWPGYDPYEGTQGIPVIRAPRWSRADDSDW